jgi:beta-lactamase class A
MLTKILFLLFTILSFTMHEDPKLKLENDIQAELKSLKGDFAVAFYDFKTKKTLSINIDEVFHAASTMKTPVMMEVMRLVATGKFKLSDEIILKNEFKSIIDGSPYSMELGVDSDEILYTKIGTKVRIEELVFQMITKSSNLATNVLIEKVGAKNVMKYLADLNIKGINVLRGVEDTKAFKAGKNNTTTAAGLRDMFIAIETSSQVKMKPKMKEILLAQYFNEMIPALLPKDVKVAHKTGNVTGVEHDGGIVYLPNGRKYVLILLSKNQTDTKPGVEAFARISKLVYNYVKGES